MRAIVFTPHLPFDGVAYTRYETFLWGIPLWGSFMCLSNIFYVNDFNSEMMT